ncbi:hypothetical protein ACGF5O_48650, partial [Streptomyces sp. NPDC048291]|uniref:hypothetical protein n=1 Tax=Streptomyces sp. NPDC048291 TaxID=3365530 RepID=UPI0037220004
MVVTIRTYVITWGRRPMEPINTRAPAAAARAYIQLGWSVSLLTFPLSCRVEREAGFGEATLDEVGASLDAA